MSTINKRFTFGEGIQYALDKIAFPGDTQSTYNEDAQIIENSLIKEISLRDPKFREAYRGLSLVGSYLDAIKIELPDEFDMHVKIHLPCCKPKPICVEDRPGFVFLRACDKDHPCVRHFNVGSFISRLAVQSWIRDNITAVMPKLQAIPCSGGRVYNLKYAERGFGVAHTLVATEKQDRTRRISFDFVPVFEFEVEQWPQGLQKPVNDGRSWFAVPRKYFKTPENQQDPRSFILCAPHWERSMIEKKMNLKNSLRLMKAFRNANKLGRLVSYFLKSVYLNEVEKESIDWNQAPGLLLIEMLDVLVDCLRTNNLPFFPAPDHNNLGTLSDDDRRGYVYIISRNLETLKRCRDADYLAYENMSNLFGIK